MKVRVLPALAATAALLLLAGASTGARTGVHGVTVPAGAPYTFPLHVSANGRYLVDARDRPFLLVGDSPQALIGDLSVADARAFMANRRSHGIDALWVNLLCAKYTGCADDGKTRDGIPPFTTPGDLATPNPAYFARADAMIRLAQAAGMAVFLDPIETGGWLSTLRSTGPDKAFAYGRFLGQHFRAFPNIVWLNGNDFQSWHTAGDDALVLAVARGIRSVDPAHLQTVELNYFDSASRDDARWRPLLDIDAAYTYRPTYARVLREYRRPRPLPVVMVEAGYEAEQIKKTISPGEPAILRREEYWSMLSGAAGQFYGNHFTWQFVDGWKDHLDTAGSAQLGYLVELLRARPWYALVPDARHTFVTAGYGTFTDGGNVGSSAYTTAAVTADGTLGLAYLPQGGTLTVDLTRLRRHVTGRWFDPSAGSYRPIAPALLESRGRVRVASPGANAAGDHDWVLVLEGR